jgi:cbb3-type cytochrome oxidase maturation protein
MNVILVLIPLSIVCAAGFLAAFIWAVRSGQFEDTCTPSLRLLLDDSGKNVHAKTGLRRSPAGARVSDPARIDVRPTTGPETGAPANGVNDHDSPSSESKSNQP